MCCVLSSTPTSSWTTPTTASTGITTATSSTKPSTSITRARSTTKSSTSTASVTTASASASAEEALPALPALPGFLSLISKEHGCREVSLAWCLQAKILTHSFSICHPHVFFFPNWQSTCHSLQAFFFEGPERYRKMFSTEQPWQLPNPRSQLEVAARHHACSCNYL